MRPGSRALPPHLLPGSPLRDSLAGRVFKGSGNVSYHLRECIGEGGQGWVFRANWDDPEGHVVIVKVLKPDAVQTEMLGRFRREADVLRLLSTQPRPNPYIVRFFDHAVATFPASKGGEPTALPFTVLEFVDGATLDKVLREHAGRGLPTERVRRLLRQICQALDVVHAQKIVHRDLKPSNILLATEAGTEIAKVTDFGLVKLVDVGSMQKTTTLAGASLGYAPPEQYEKGNKRVSPKTDLFSLAAVVFEMLSGQSAFPFIEGENPIVVVSRVLMGPRPSLAKTKGLLAAELAQRPDLVTAIDRELTRAMASDPNERHASVMDFWSVLDPMLRSVSGRPSDPKVFSRRDTPFEATVKMEEPKNSERRPSHAHMPAVSGADARTWTTCVAPKSLTKIRAAAFSTPKNGIATEAVAIAESGIFRWEGRRWTPVLLPSSLPKEAIRGVKYMPDGAILVFGEGGLVARLSTRGEPTIWRVPDTSITFHGAFVEDTGIATLVTLVGEHPYRGKAVRTIPDPVTGVVAQFSGERLTLIAESPSTGCLRAVTRLRTGQLVTCGDWGALAAVELGVVSLVGFICQAHLRAIAPLPEGGAVTIGTLGHALVLSSKLEHKLEPVHTTRDLLTCAPSEDGTAWAGSVDGRVLRRLPGESSTWTRIGDAEIASSITSNVVAIACNQHLIRAIGDDGTVVEGRLA